jgi:lysophospholipase L1-like esterase
MLKRQAFRISGAGVLLIGLMALTGEAQAQLRIMPLGDSITYGTGYPGYGGYRVHLWAHFQEDGLDAVFVGSQQNGPPELGSKDHEGHPGWRIDQIDANIEGWLDTYQPDIILLHIGTNDCIQNYHLDTIGDRLSGLIDKITDRSPDAVLVVALITPMANPTYDQRAQDFNALIPDIVAEKVADGRMVTLVDMYNAGVTLTSDGVHPDQPGYDTMADVWYDMLQALLGGPGGRSGDALGCEPHPLGVVDFE